MKSYSAQANEWKMKRYALLLYVILTFIPISLMDHLSHISQKKFECRPQEWSVQKFASRNSHHEISKLASRNLLYAINSNCLEVSIPCKNRFFVTISPFSRIAKCQIFMSTAGLTLAMCNGSVLAAVAWGVAQTISIYSSDKFFVSKVPKNCSGLL